MTIRVGLLGATGLVGGEIARLLAARGVPARCLVRSDARAAPLLALGHELVRADLDAPETLGPALGSLERLLLLTSDHPHQDVLERRVIDAAANSKVGRIVKISAQSAGDPPVSFGRLHRRAEDALRASGMPHVVVRPVFFMQSFLKFAETIRRGRIVIPNGKGKVAMVDSRDVAAVAVEALLGESLPAPLVVTGPTSLTFGKAAQILGDAIGRKVAHVSPPALLARVVLPFASGMPRWLSSFVVDLAVAQASGYQAAVTDTVERVTGRPPRTFAEFCRENRASFV
jgi:uncharacterized protein YbjT (DUF2867 family)